MGSSFTQVSKASCGDNLGLCCAAEDPSGRKSWEEGALGGGRNISDVFCLCRSVRVCMRGVVCVWKPEDNLRYQSSVAVHLVL